jgi:hypothetical protein
MVSYALLINRIKSRKICIMRHYATTRKVTGSIPNEVIGFFQFTLSFEPPYGPGVNSASNRNEYQGSSYYVLDNSETTYRLKRYTVLTLPDRPE